MKEGKIGCPKCGGHIAFPPELAGTPVSCPHCQAGIVLPKGKSGLPWIVGAIAVMAAICALVLAIIKANQPPPHPPTPFELQMQKAEKGDPKAMWEAGLAYMNGRQVTTNLEEGAKWVRKAAEAGEPKAMEWLADTKLLAVMQAFRTAQLAEQANGLTVRTLSYTNFPEECFRWFRTAAELGNTNAMWDLVRYLNYGATTEVDPTNGLPSQSIFIFDKFGSLVPPPSGEMIHWLNQLVKAGDTQAMIELGCIDIHGYNVPTNQEGGIQLLKEAGDFGDAEGYFLLGNMYEKGDGMPKDPAMAVEWYQKAAAQNHLSATFYMAEMYRDNDAIKDLEQSFKWFSDLAGKPFHPDDELEKIIIPEVWLALGKAYDKGQGVAENKYMAVTWYTKAAEAGLPEAQFQLGLKYDLGEGMAKDWPKALEWYRKAASQTVNGSQSKRVVAVAQRNIGLLYKLGQGVQKNPQLAFDWFYKAAENGSVSSQFEVARAYGTGVGALQNSQDAFKWYQKSANQGYRDSQAKLGLFYLKNVNNRTNGSEFRIMAHAWLNLSAAQGYEPAAEMRNNLVRKMSPAEITEAQRRAKAFDDGDSLLTNSLPNLDTTALLEAPAESIAAAEPADLPDFQVINVTARTTEQNDIWWRYGYRLVVRNNSQAYSGQWFTIQFLDAQGFVIDTTITQRTVIAPGTASVITGDALINLPGAARVASLKAIWKQ